MKHKGYDQPEGPSADVNSTPEPDMKKKTNAEESRKQREQTPEATEKKEKLAQEK